MVGADGGGQQGQQVGVTVAGQGSDSHGWKPGYTLAGVPMSGWEWIHRSVRSLP